MRVEISVLEPGCEILTYTAGSEAECHDEVDRFAYRHVVKNGLDCRVGCVLATLVRPTPATGDTRGIAKSLSSATGLRFSGTVR